MGAVMSGLREDEAMSDDTDEAAVREDWSGGSPCGACRSTDTELLAGGVAHCRTCGRFGGLRHWERFDEWS